MSQCAYIGGLHEQEVPLHQLALKVLKVHILHLPVKRSVRVRLDALELVLFLQTERPNDRLHTTSHFKPARVEPYRLRVGGLHA